MKLATIGLLVAAAVGLAACGGSRAEHTTAGVAPTSTAVVVVPPSQAPTATQSTATARPKPGPKRPSLHPGASAGRTGSAGARRGATGGTRSRGAVRSPRSRQYISGFAGQQCLAGSGLLNPLPVKGGWMGVDANTHYLLYVDGPFKSRAAAGRAAKIRQPGDDVALTGLFVVWARAKSHLRAEVDTVAKCLKHGAGKSLTF